MPSRFGLSQNDAKKITDWLQSQGFTVVQHRARTQFYRLQRHRRPGRQDLPDPASQLQDQRRKLFANDRSGSDPGSSLRCGQRISAASTTSAPKSQARIAPSITTPSTSMTAPTTSSLPAISLPCTTSEHSLYQRLSTAPGSLSPSSGRPTSISIRSHRTSAPTFGLSAISCTTSKPMSSLAPATHQLQLHPCITGDADPARPTPFGDDLPEADIDIECSGATAPRRENHLRQRHRS